MPLITIEQIEKMLPAFRGRFGNSLARLLMRILSVDTLSDIYDRQSAYDGADFAGACLRDKDIHLNYQIGNAERLETLPEGPFITIANHPYGGLDGIVLIDLFGHMREGYKYMVNEVLNLVDKLRPCLIAVDPKTDVSEEITIKNLQGVKEVLQRTHDGFPVGFFPAGAVSNLHLKGLKIYDREWQPSVMRLIKKCKVPIIPVRFFDHNSWWFYNLGLISWKVRILQLPHEIVNKRFRRFRLGIGETISVEEQMKHKDLKDYTAFLREKVYGMPLPDNFIKYKDYLANGRKYNP